MVDPEALIPMIPRVVAEIDSDVPVTNLKTLTSAVNASVDALARDVTQRTR